MTTETQRNDRRDLRADLALCSVATAGPWTASGIGSWSADTKVDGITGDVYEDVDATFIAEARTGWPIAIERAINAEGELRRVREAIGWLRFAYERGDADEALAIAVSTFMREVDANE
ncbi:hypothetical protein NST07_25965 [Paenibacillus sp. FSL L8-0340]|uniref:hypothetical protein n=1 Tax=Paenibacillus sp. FSL L8-0340 TaxID=2954685 RepID=UPI003158586D